MKSVVSWVLARRLRVAVVAVVFALLLPVISTALIALETAERGFQKGLGTAAMGVVGIVGIVLAAHGGWPMIGLGAACLVAGVVLGALLRLGSGMRLAFQGAVLIGAVAILVAGLLGLGPAELFGPALHRFIGALQDSGATPAQIQTFRAALPMLFGWIAAALVAELLVALFLTCWWMDLVDDERRFGAEFRALKLGWVLGLPGAIVFAVSLVLHAPLIQNLAPLALLGFLFQGLSVLHAWFHVRHWHTAWLVAVYFSLVTPLAFVMVIGLGGTGLIDNWFDLRARMRT